MDLKVLYNKLLYHKKTITYCIIIFVITLLVSMIIYGYLSNPTILDINGTKYTKEDYMLYLYTNKLALFGEGKTDLSKETLNSLVSTDSNLTVREYLEKQTLSQIKTSYVVDMLAKKYDIELSKEDLKEIDQEKSSFIKKVGGQKEFKKLLKENNTSIQAYDKIAKNDKLYKLIFNTLYSEGKSKDLTSEEKESAQKIYYSSYKKIRQIVLTTIDLNTKEPLITSIINQKKSLINSILNDAKNGVDFDELIKTYSEDVNNSDGPYYIYYTDGQMLKEIEDAVNNLSDEEISDVVETSYGYHIIKREALDDGYLDTFYDKKREEKLLKDISEEIENLQLNYHNSFKNIEIN